MITILFAVLAPLIAMLIRFAVSRRREYLADATAASAFSTHPPLADRVRRLRAIAGRSAARA